ncbi:MAG TPA: response regulator [bacterium]|nr:response regulator [bacterium]
MNEKILIISDKENLKKLCRDLLEKRNFIFEETNNGFVAIDKIKNNEFTLILLDLQISEIDGFQFIKNVREFNNLIPIVVIDEEIKNAVKAINSGANDLLIYPFDINQFFKTIKKNIEIGSLLKEVSRLKIFETLFELNKNIGFLTDIDTFLENISDILLKTFSPERISIYLIDKGSSNFILRKHKYIADKTNKQKMSYSKEEINKIFGSEIVKLDEQTKTIRAFVRIKGKEKEVGLLDIEISKNIGIFEKNEVKFLELFSMQIGIGIENSILLETIRGSYFLNTIECLIKSLEVKDGYTKQHSEMVAYYATLLGKRLELSDEEIETLKISSFLHDLGKLGVKNGILSKEEPLTPEEKYFIKKHPLITVNILRPLNVDKEKVEACLYHHERVDGRGYPEGLSGEKIPLYAKILAIADAYSAMRADRPYRKALSKEEAISELLANAGTQFDRELVNVFIDILNKMEVNNEGDENRGDNTLF